MLGDRRSNSLFASGAAKPAPEANPGQAEVHNISFEENTGRAIFAESQVAPKASDLFFAPQAEGMPFGEVLSQVQSYLSGTYATLITEGGEEAKEQMKRRIARYLQDNRMAVDGMTASELVDALYTEMAEYGFLTKYIFADGIEEIDVNSWRDIEIQYSDGRTVKLDEHFDSPEHASNVIRRMLQNSGKVLDNASPIITSRLAKNIRVSVIKTPVLDEDAGVAASIRIVNPKNLTKEDFITSGTATGEMLDFLSACLRYGVSICVAGATSSGKTTVAGWLLSTIPDRKRIFTIEDGSRELQLIRERNGKVVNSVVHTQTRDSENERQRIDQIALLDIALRFNPDIIAVGEMRGPEANAAQEAARVGVAVLTTIHSSSSEGTYRRMVSLCKRAVDTPDDIKNVFAEGELDEKSNVQFLHIANSDKPVAFYNLDVIISVGYRVKSLRGTQFRIWANSVLKEYLIKGFAMNDELLKQAGGGNYFDELLERIRDIRSSEKVFWRKVLDIYATSVDYDPRTETSVLFFKTVQNKMHWAAHGHTAAEKIYFSADSTKPNMGLYSFAGAHPTQAEALVAKNYCNAEELEQLNSIVSAYLEFAEMQARRRIPMYMGDWIETLDGFLKLSKHEILSGAGKISATMAEKKAKDEYRKYKVSLDHQLSAADMDCIKALESEEQKLLGGGKKQ